MRVLYLNHTSKLSGAERSLLELLAGLPSAVDAAIACPPGDFAGAVRTLLLPVTTLPGTEVSFRLHPLHTAKGIAKLTGAAAFLRASAGRFRPALVHANSVRAGLIAALAFPTGDPPIVLHVRDCLPRTRTARLVKRVLASRTALIFTNSQYTAASFTSDTDGARVRPVHNAVDLARFDPRSISRQPARARLGLEDGTLALGVVAQITPWKAQDDAITVMQALRRKGRNVRLFIVGDAKFTFGSTRYDNEAYKRSLHVLAENLGVAEAVTFLGERADVPDLLRALDLVLVPSWEEPFGRTVIEAMAMEVPVLATHVGGPAEIIEHGRDGLLLPPRQPLRWADEADRLLADERRRTDLGRRGREKVVSAFTRAEHVRRVLDGYEEALQAGRATS